MRALSVGELGEATESFFRGRKPSPSDFNDLPLPSRGLSPERKPWMWATFIIGLVGATAIGGTYYYHRFYMPLPVELGKGGPVELPKFEWSEPQENDKRIIEAEPESPSSESPSPISENSQEEKVEAPSNLTSESPTSEQATGEPPPVEAKPSDSQAAPPPPPAPSQTESNEQSYEALLAQARKLHSPSRQIPLLERAIELNPNGSEALSQLAYALINKGGRSNLERARELAERAVQSDPQNAQGWLVLGAARSELGDRAGAREAKERCVQQGKGPFVAQCRTLL
ncbi:MAG: tetratricopeptide repeat protein [Sandaracinaceae bacterium]|nr:tetratricopeptide repeat protein [Sandaracinaceae bacterium]